MGMQWVSWRCKGNRCTIVAICASFCVASMRIESYLCDVSKALVRPTLPFPSLPFPPLKYPQQIPYGSGPTTFLVFFAASTSAGVVAAYLWRGSHGNGHRGLYRRTRGNCSRSYLKCGNRCWNTFWRKDVPPTHFLFCVNHIALAVLSGVLCQVVKRSCQQLLST